MVGRIALLGLVLTLFAQRGVQPAWADGEGLCTLQEIKDGTCHTAGSNDGNSTTVGAHAHHGQAGAGAGSSGPTGRPALPLTDEQLLAYFDAVCVGNGHCDVLGSLSLNPRLPVEKGAPPKKGEPARVVTIDDLARFLPAAATLHAEPAGWAVVGVPANFFADARVMVVDGELLGERAQVRFTPVAYRFDYGDGASRTSSTPGASWASFGQRELTETPTSHIYTRREDRRATITTVYAAEYRVADGPWTQVRGAVSATTPPQRVLVVVERTALTTPA